MATPDSPNPILFPEWQNEYAAALLEFDDKCLRERVAAAETAIFKRLQQISQDSDHHAERKIIEDALESLRCLQTHDLGFPDWRRTDHAALR
jgi:hypothetical protein